MARADRLGMTIGGMVLTVPLVFGGSAGCCLLHVPPTDASVKVVDPPTITAAQKSGPFPPAYPSPVPAGWQATSVRYRVSPTNPKIATWHLGFYIPATNMPQWSRATPTTTNSSPKRPTREGRG